MTIQLKLTGSKVIDDVLRGLPLQVNDRLLTSAHKTALRATTDVAKSIVQVKEGTLRESIGSVSGGTVKRTGELGLVRAGALISKQRAKRAASKGYHGHLIEFGHDIVVGGKKGKGGRVVGRVKAYPFMEPAWERTKDKVLASVGEILGNKLYEFMRRTLKK